MGAQVRSLIRCLLYLRSAYIKRGEQAQEEQNNTAARDSGGVFFFTPSYNGYRGLSAVF